MAYKVSNNAFSTLAGAINSIATSLTVGTGHGDRFPVITGADHTFVTLEDASGNIEIVKVTARASASDVMTIVRAQDGTTARSWAAGDVVECRIIASLLNDAIAHLSDTSDAHAASAITNTPAGNIAATTVQAALNELDTELSAGIATANSNLTAHLNDTSDAHDASAISYAGGTGISATDVEAAIDELATEKMNLAGGTLTGGLTMSGASIIEAEGAAVAAAATTNIWATDGNTIHITGNTAITSFGTAPQAGARMKLIFDGTPLLTQGANLNLNAGGSNIQIEANDWAEVYAGTTTQFDVVVHRKSGNPVAGGAAATTTSSGIVELITTAELQTGTDTTRAVTADAIRQGLIVSGTPITTTSGTSHDYTSIPSWVKRITVMFSGVSTNGTSVIQLQIGDSGGIENTGYLGAHSTIASSSGVTSNITTGFGVAAPSAAQVMHGVATIVLLDAATFTWAYSFTGAISNAGNTLWAGGSKSLSAALDRIRLTTVNGTDAFDAGTVNIIYE